MRPVDEIRRDRDHRRLRPLARDAQRGRARTGPADDRRQIQRLGDLPRGVGDGVADGRLRLGALRIEHAAIGRIALHFLADPVHGRDRLDRKLAGRRFRRQHDGVGAFVDRGGDVGDLGAGRHRALDHRFQHLGGDHHRLAGAPRQPRHLLLQARHPLQRQFDAEIAARHHQRVGGLDDFGQPVDRLRLFDLGHHGGAAANQFLGLEHILGALHEGQRDPVDPGHQRRIEVGAILRRHRRNRQIGVGQADALAVRHPAADHDAGDGALRRGFFRDQPHLAVVEQQRVARPQRRQNFRMRKLDAGCCRPGPCRNRARSCRRS